MIYFFIEYSVHVLTFELIEMLNFDPNNFIQE
jgi:hypothetical protein